MTQAERILKHLRTEGSLTQRQAFRLYGVQRLAARIKDLRDAGQNIETDMVTVRTRAGKTSIASYSLEEETQSA